MTRQANIRDEIFRTFEADPVMYGLLERLGMPHESRHENIFIYLVRTILAQQLSVKVAQSIFQSFIGLFDEEPSPQMLARIAEDELRKAGLSRQKASYLHHLANFFIKEPCQGAYWDTQSDQELIQSLTTIKGVGIWTVQMLLMFALGRNDVFPVKDLGIKNGMKQLYGVHAEGRQLEKKLEAISDNWRPFRSVGSKLIWMAKEQI